MCNHVGHFATYCHTMRCYSCRGIGHKDQDCGSTQRQPMRIFSYNSTRKDNTNEGENAERENAKKQVLMKNTGQIQIGEIDQSREDGFQMEIQV